MNMKHLFLILFLISTPAVAGQAADTPSTGGLELAPVAEGVGVNQTMRAAREAVERAFPRAFSFYTVLSFEEAWDGDFVPRQLTFYVPVQALGSLDEEVLEHKRETIIESMSMSATGCPTLENKGTMERYNRNSRKDEQVVKFALRFYVGC